MSTQTKFAFMDIEPKMIAMAYGELDAKEKESLSALIFSDIQLEELFFEIISLKAILSEACVEHSPSKKSIQQILAYSQSFCAS